jgi:hypothetical protein
MIFDTPESNDRTMPLEKKRQIFFLGMGLYGAIFFINVAFVLSYQLSKPHIAVVRVLGPAITIVFTVVDSIFLRSTCRKQFPANPELLTKWPINVPEYPTWIYFVYLFWSLVLSGYLLSRL